VWIKTALGARTFDFVTAQPGGTGLIAGYKLQTSLTRDSRVFP
jgi:hypothetical protein